MNTLAFLLLTASGVVATGVMTAAAASAIKRYAARRMPAMPGNATRARREDILFTISLLTLVGATAAPMIALLIGRWAEAAVLLVPTIVALGVFGPILLRLCSDREEPAEIWALNDAGHAMRRRVASTRHRKDAR